MKEKIIETAGKTWKTLGAQGEISIPQLAKLLDEKEDIVCQAIGWLAREDKINYATKSNKTLVSLVASEMEQFSRLIQASAAQPTTSRIKEKAASASSRWGV